MSIMTLGQLRELIKDLPDETPILTQLVTANGTQVWNLLLSGGFGEHFKWEFNPFIFNVGHPEIMKLPDWESLK